jgi:hypothetical protein
MELERIVNKALSKDPAQRYQHVDEFLVDLKSVAKAMKPGEAGAGVVPGMGRARGRFYAYAAVMAFVGVMAVSVAILYKLGVFDRAAESIDSIAVLPMENLSGDPNQEYFVDGMTDALIADLAKIKALRAISGTSAMH